MKTLRFILYAFLLVVGVTACSNNLDESVDGDILWSPDDDVIVECSIFDNEGENTTVFSKNENFIFDLCITNRSDNDLIYYEFFNEKSDLVLDKDLFCVYTEKGKRIGTPWTQLLQEAIFYVNGRRIAAGTSYHIRCSAYEQYDANGQALTTLPLWRDPEETPFPTLDKGDYYTSFVVKYKNDLRKEKLISKKLKVNFKVQ